jgi:hypothetical protein
MIYLFTSIEFPPGGSGVGKRQQLYTKGETINNAIQKHRIHKIENQNTKQENNHKKNITQHVE